jgi:hypothetical protein
MNSHAASLLQHSYATTVLFKLYKATRQGGAFTALHTAGITIVHDWQLQQRTPAACKRRRITAVVV